MQLSNRYIEQTLLTPKPDAIIRLHTERLCDQIMDSGAPGLLSDDERAMARELLFRSIVDRMAVDYEGGECRLTFRLSGHDVWRMAERLHLSTEHHVMIYDAAAAPTDTLCTISASVPWLKPAQWLAATVSALAEG